jgi:hypothetical protein
MFGIDEKRLEDLRGVLLTWQLRLRQADEEIEQAQKDHKQTTPYCTDAVGYLKEQLKDDRRRQDAACETFFNLALPIEQRLAAAAEFTRLQEAIRQAEADIKTLEAEVATSLAKVRRAGSTRAMAKREHERVLRLLIRALLEISSDSRIHAFRDAFNRRAAGYELKTERDEIHVYVRGPKDLHYQQGHLVIGLDGTMSFIRGVHEPRREAVRYSGKYEKLLVYDGCRSTESGSTPFFFSTSLFFNESAALMLP